MGKKSEQSVVLSRVLCAFPNARLHQRRENAEGSLENLRHIFAASTKAQELQLRQELISIRQELNSIRQRDMLVTDYTTKIKEICDALGSINITIDEGQMVQIGLGGLA